jgi:hypothetical protein
MGLTNVIAIALGAFLILLFAWFTYQVTDKQGRKEHILLRLILIFFFLNMLVLLSKSATDNCEIKLNYTDNVYVYGSNFTGYHWDYDFTLNPAQVPDYELFHVREYNEYIEVCPESVKTTNSVFFKNMSRLMYVFWFYIIVYISYVFLKFKNWIPKLK